MTALILASGSATRAAMLRAAGVVFTQVRPAFDEDAGKHRLRQEGAEVSAQVVALAHGKARSVSAQHPGALVLGSDQMLECGGVVFDKPRDGQEAAAHLRRLSGRSHRLVTAAVLLRAEAPVWSWVDAPELEMRALSESFLAQYLQAVGEGALQSPGAYQVEGLGAQLFTRIAGDWFSILGLPLLPLLAELRRLGELAP